ncbi:MAG: hypothetical protein SF123_02835 [Chloroflexota bacterium]|nr:hypothetical protein [Chloroflexota bacterium]
MAREAVTTVKIPDHITGYDESELASVTTRIDSAISEAQSFVANSRYSNEAHRQHITEKLIPELQSAASAAASAIDRLSGELPRVRAKSYLKLEPADVPAVDYARRVLEARLATGDTTVNDLWAAALASGDTYQLRALYDFGAMWAKSKNQMLRMNLHEETYAALASRENREASARAAKIETTIKVLSMARVRAEQAAKSRWEARGGALVNADDDKPIVRF